MGSWMCLNHTRLLQCYLLYCSNGLVAGCQSTSRPCQNSHLVVLKEFCVAFSDWELKIIQVSLPLQAQSERLNDPILNDYYVDSNNTARIVYTVWIGAI